MLSADQFARVKALFEQLCDVPAAEQRCVLQQIQDDAEVVAELHLLLDKTLVGVDHSAQPVLNALAALSEAPRSGDVLGAWTLHEEIGQGGMGKVFLARRSDGQFDQVAAIKLLSGRPSAAAQRFLARERQILASLSHPNIARLFDGGSTSQGQPYLVMEYVQGLQIHRYCSQHGLTLTARVRLMTDVCAAVSHAHQQLIVHCDLKPGNILVTGSGRPLLLDFGISRLVDTADSAGSPEVASPSTHVAVTGAAYTPRYASPEQKARQPVGTASDIYSLGLVLAELLDLEWPDGQQPSLHKLPAELAAIIERATYSQVADRYGSVEEFAADLRRYLAHQVILARPPTAFYIMRKWLRRNWSWTAAAIGFLALATTFSLQMREERDNALRAERTARAVKDYMVSVFQGADPEMSGQRDLPVSALLDAGSERLQGALKEDPRSRAELSSILGSVYQSIGQRERALALFDQSIEQARRHSWHLLLAEALHKKAYSLYDMGEFKVALAPAREALMLRERYAVDSIERVASMRLLGSILGYSGETQEAPQLLSQALEMATRLRGAESIDAGSAHLDLARYFGGIGGHADLVLHHSELAGKFFAQQLGAGHFRVSDALEIRILGLAQSNQAAPAVPLAQELVAQRTALYGEISHPRSYALNVLGSMLRRAGRNLEAAPIFQNSLDIHEQLDGPESVASLVPMLGLGLTYENAGAHDSALKIFERQLAIHAQHSPATDITPAGLRLHVARNERLLGRLDQAQTALKRVLAEYRADAATPPEDRVAAQIELAALSRQLGDLAAAQAAIDAIAPADFADDPLSSGRMAAEQGRIALARNEPDQARSLFQQAQLQLVGARGENDTEACLVQIDYAEWLVRSGASEQARALAIEMASKVRPGIDPAGRWADRLRRLGVSI
jgi:eukaryotic-like serine/threonine-protein kinase